MTIEISQTLLERSRRNKVEQELLTSMHEASHARNAATRAEADKSRVQSENLSLSREVDFAESQLRDTKRELEKVKEENEEYEWLLCRPMQEIAQKHLGFRKAYEEQQKMMASWMVSQKAFKELAIQFGLEKGMTPQEVIEKEKAVRADVLNNKNPENHGTNADDPFLSYYREDIKKDYGLK